MHYACINNGWMAEMVDAMDSKSIAPKGHEGSNPSPPTTLPFTQSVFFKIKNIRAGFATNSSSTHSIVVVGKNNLYKNFRNDPDFRIKNFINRIFGTPDTLFERKRRSGETGFRVKILHETHYYDVLTKFFYIAGIIYKNIRNITQNDAIASEFLCCLYKEITGKDFIEDFLAEIQFSQDLIFDASRDEKNLSLEYSEEDIKYLGQLKSDLIYINGNIRSWLQKNTDSVFKKISQDVRDSGVEYEIANPDLRNDETEDFKKFLKDLVKLFCSDNVMLYSFEYDESCPNGVEYLREMNFKLDNPEDIRNLEKVLFDGAYYNDVTYSKRRSPVLLNKGEKIFKFKREEIGTGVDYVFFNKITGTKLRFSLDLNKWNDYSEKLSSSREATYKIDLVDLDLENNEKNKNRIPNTSVKALYPELVDLKITNYCVFGCEFCYQSSTREGSHAPFSKLKKYINVLSDLKVFEIAIGGGEPTMHPEFPEILEYIRKKGIIANFTTYSAKWLKNPEILEAVVKYASGIGVSVHNHKDIEKVKLISRIVEEKKDELFLDYCSTKVVAQHVFGTVDADEFSKLLKTAVENNIHILLLGPKRTGFGRDFNFIDPEALLFYVKLYFNTENIKKVFDKPVVSLDTSLSVDTEFALRFEKFLREDMGIAPELYTTREGLYSFYIDGVEDKMAKSSYVNSDEYQKLPINCDVNSLKDIVYKNYLKY